MRDVAVLVLALNSAALLHFQQGSNQAQPLSVKVEIGPNVRASDKGVSHVEAYVAAHPRDPKSLIIVTSHEVEGGDLIAEAIRTSDGGRTWSVKPLPKLAEWFKDGKLRIAVDNWVIFALDGTAHLSTLPDMKGTPILVYRSEDQGETWQGPTVVPARGAFDRPTMVASGKNNQERVYVVASDAGGFAVLRSDDGGLSFKTMAFIEPDNLAHQPHHPQVLPDGSLLVPYDDYPFISVEELQEMRRDPAKQRMNSSRIYVLRSQDGGATFGLPQFVADIPRMFPGGLETAVDLSSGRFRGRIYLAWNGEREERRNVTIAYSTDGGKRNWLKSAVLRSEQAGPAYFYSLAVSPDGTVGVSWLQHEREEGKSHCYRIYFAASIDGGETFTPPAVVSGAISCPNAAAIHKKIIGRWARGNDYMGLAAAADGSFHPVWVDARDGAYQVFTARIEVRK